MRVFVTGATGFVGSAVVRGLIGAGHQVLGLTRSDTGAAAVAAMGAEPVRGTLEDTASLARGAAAADAVVHTAFDHDFSDFGRVCALDEAAILAMGAALAGSMRALLVTSGVGLLAQGRPATEADRPPGPEVFPRQSEAAAAAVAALGVRAGTVRLPPTVHGSGDHAFVPQLIALARRTGVSAMIGDGGNRWSAVHRDDAARVFQLALTRGPEAGPFHAVAEAGVAFREIAASIGRQLGVRVVELSPDAAAAHFGPLAMFVGWDLAVDSTRTRAALGWAPREVGLLEDLANPAYFAA